MAKMLAFDFGASSGRAIIGELKEDKLTLREIHRFPNDPVMFSKHLQWDMLRLTYEIKQGLLKCKNNGDGDIESVGVDTWGVDFGLIDEHGELISNPYHYRDSRTEGMIENCFRIIPQEELFNRTGLQIAPYNTIYQLLAMQDMKDKSLDIADTLLLMPDLINYMLTGEKVSEYTEVTTTQLYNYHDKNWDKHIINSIGIQDNIFTKIVNPGTVIGDIRNSICTELDIKPSKVIAVASHDTASAVVAVPAKEENWAFLSSGTWSLVGIESDKPIINDLVSKYNFTNEGGADNKINFTKNIMGLWIVQECRRQWEKEGKKFDFSKLVDMATLENGLTSFIDPDNLLFYAPGEMPDKVRKFCIETGQIVPETAGQIIRCVEESLAFKCRWAIERIEEITCRKIDIIHMVGGGIKDNLLCQLTANATGRKVVAGPVEATAIGNILVQALALGEIRDIAHGREVVRNSFEVVEYLPQDVQKWEESYGKFMSILK